MKSVMKAAMVFFLALMITAPAWADGVSIRGLMDPVIVDDSRSGVVRLSLEEPEGSSAKKDKLKNLSQDWGGFGGPMIMYLQLDLDGLDPLTDDRGIDDFESEMLLIGGLGGLIYKDFRMGGFGFGNSQDVSGRSDAGIRRSADMNIGGGGLFFEVNHTYSPNFGMAAGVMLGAGGIDLEASGDDLGPDQKWDADGSFFMSYPYLGFWVAPTNWMWVQLDAGYLFFELDTGGSEWENDLGVKMVDNDLTGGFSAGLKVNFGLNPNAK